MRYAWGRWKKTIHSLASSELQHALGQSHYDSFRGVVHRHPLVPLAAISALGILIDSLLGRLFGTAGFTIRAACWLGFTAFLVGLIVHRRLRFPVPATLLVFLPMAAGLHCLQDARYYQSDLFSVMGDTEQAAVLEGVIDRPVVLRRQNVTRWRDRQGGSAWQTQFELGLNRMRLGRAMESCCGRVLVHVNGNAEQLKPGDIVRVYGNLCGVDSPRNPGEPDLQSFIRQRGLHGRVTCDAVDQVVRLGYLPSLTNRFFAGIESIASDSRDLLLRHLDGATGDMAAALVLGQRGFVDESTRDRLLVTGTAHLLSVSGLHVAIVVGMAGWIATIGRFPLSVKLIWVLLVCVLYTGITGARPPVVRAAILVTTLMLSLWMRRPSQPINTLALAAMILMALNPQLLFNLGVQLSFLAVATLMTCNHDRHQHDDSAQISGGKVKRLEQLIDQSRSRGGRLFHHFGHWCLQATWFSVCVATISMPLVWQHFHVVAPVSIVTNVLLTPLLLIALGFGITTILTGFLFDSWMFIPAKVCELAMEIMQWIISGAASIPGGHHWLPAPPGWWVATFYILLIMTTLIPNRKRSSFIRYGWIATWTVTAFFLATSQPPLTGNSLEATFVDVGHGTCVVLRFGNEGFGDEEMVWIYDCGRLGNDSYNSRGIESVLWSLGVTKVQGVFLSHADADHFNALPGLIRRFEVEAIYTPCGLFQDPEPALATVAREVKKQKIKVIQLQSGLVVRAGEHRMRVLHPSKLRVEGSDNANSLVLRIDVGGKSMILPGDLEPPGTEMLMRQDRPNPGGVLMAPHHGSLKMDAASVLQWSRPSVTIVSGGRRAGKQEVHDMLARTGSTVHVTNQTGAVRVQMGGTGKINVQTWIENPW